MRLLSAVLVTSFTVALIWFLNRSMPSGDKSIPALGQFFNPFSGFWRNAAPITGSRSHTISIPGLSAAVSVQFDELDIPHIFAENLQDAARVQGYLTARDRLWQMDINVRKAAGRLSEVLGERTLATDRLSRRSGMVFAAENTLLALRKNEQAQAYLQAYTDGVNAWIEQLDPGEYPIECKLLGYKPEPWTLLKCCLVIENMSETLASKQADLESTNALAALGRERFDDLYAEYFPEQTPVVEDAGQWKDIKPFNLPFSNASWSGVLPLSESRYSYQAEADPYQVGSNNWALSGAKTAGGRPLLANDPHLTLTLPSIWYQVQVNVPGSNVYGVSLPGLPGVIIGFNEEYAWGITNVSQDVADWYKIQWSNKDRTQYMIDGEVKEVRKQIETIKVKGKPAVLDTVRYTVFGPVVYDFDAQHPLRDCAYRWLAHEMPSSDLLLAFKSLSFGRTYQDYRQALSVFDCPAQNFVFASRSGDIGITVQGRFPLRSKEQGRFVLEGNRWANTWQGYIPQDEIPYMKNPERGFTYSANQHSTPPTYPYYYLGNFESSRGRRVHERLSAMQMATVDSMKSMQLDNFSRRSADAVKAMLPLLDYTRIDAEGRLLAEQIKGWDGVYAPELLAPTLFEVWFDSLYSTIWDEMDRLNRAGKKVNYPESWRTIKMMQYDTLHPFFDLQGTPVRENARDVVTMAFQKMQGYFSANPTKKQRWGQFASLSIRHLARIEPFGRANLEVGGHRTAPNAMNRTHGPSWRMIVALDSPAVKGLGVYPGGQSGNPGSRHYDDMVDVWADGRYYDLLFLKNVDESSPRIVRKEVFVAR